MPPLERRLQSNSRPSVAAPCTTKHYRVREGDTLWGIARRFKVSVDELAARNKLDPRANLPIGLDLIIPDARCAEMHLALETAPSNSGILAAALGRAVATPGCRLPTSAS